MAASHIPSRPVMGMNGADGEPPWVALISSARTHRPVAHIAQTFDRKMGTFSKPVVWGCTDKVHRIVKSLQVGRSDMARPMFTEVVLAALGRRIGAPVPSGSLVTVPANLIAAEPEAAHVLPGVGHAFDVITDVADVGTQLDPPTDKTRRTAARLAVFYGWALGGNQQLLRKTEDDGDVFTVDHGHFLPNGPEWTATGLTTAGDPTLDLMFVPQTTDDLIADAINDLEALSDQAIAGAVALPPDEWGIPDDDRVAVAKYLAVRRDRLVTLVRSA